MCPQPLRTLRSAGYNVSPSIEKNRERARPPLEEFTYFLLFPNPPLILRSWTPFSNLLPTSLILYSFTPPKKSRENPQQASQYGHSRSQYPDQNTGVTPKTTRENRVSQITKGGPTLENIALIFPVEPNSTKTVHKLASQS